MATKMTDGTDAPQEKEHAVRLLGSSPDDIVAAADFKEILSPMVEPEDVADHQIIKALLQELGLLSNRPTTNHKLAVLMSSFLLQSIRLEGRRDRTESPMYVVREPSSIGLPDQGQFSFIAFLMFKSFGLVIAFASSCKT